MVTLTILQQGTATYTAAQAVQMQFDANKISKAITISGNTQFLYDGITYIVDELVAAIFSGINYITLNVTENNITTASTTFNLNCVQMVKNVGGAAGVVYSQDPSTNLWLNTGFAVSTSTSSYASAIATMVTQGFIAFDYYIKNSATTSTLLYAYANPNALTYTKTVSGGRQFIFPNGETALAVSLYTYTLTPVFTGVTTGDVFKSITINGTTYTVNLPFVSAGNLTALAAALTTLIQTTLGGTSGTIAVTIPNSGERLIVIPTCNLSITTCIATLSAVDTTGYFVAS